MPTFSASEGTELVFEQWGAEDAQAVVLCHGLGAGAAQFAADGQWLSGQGFRVLAPDLRGHGGSGMPGSITADAFSVARLAEDQIEMLDHAGLDRVHWVGNSLGGIIGLHLAASYPDRIHTLTLFGTALSLNLPTWTAGMMPLMDRFPGRAAMARLTAFSTTRNRAARPIIAALLRRYDERAVTAIIRQISRYDLREAALNWSGPGLIMVGGRDHAVNRALLPQLEPLRDRSNWRVKSLPEGGHCANLDASEAWRSGLLDFLSADSA